MGASIVAHDFSPFVMSDTPRAQNAPHAARCHVLSWLFVGALSSAALGCAGDTAGPQLQASLQTYWALRLNYHAVNMATVAPVDTVRLIATPVNVAGKPLTGLGAVIYRTLDSAVTVDSTGLVRAHFVTPPGTYATVIASLSDATLNATHADTVLIQVTDTIPRHHLATLSVQPAPGDSAKRALDYGTLTGALGASTAFFRWSVKAVDASGAVICDSTGCPLVIDYRSSDPSVASLNDAHTHLSANRPGHTVLTAATWAYGVEKRDSVVFTIGYKTNMTIPIGLSVQTGSVIAMFGAPKRLVLGVNALVTWECVGKAIFDNGGGPVLGGVPLCDRPVDVVFDHPAGIDTGSSAFFLGAIHVGPNGSGNIPAFGGDSLTTEGDLLTAVTALLQADVRVRHFRMPGTYRYHSTLFPSDTFEIVVQ
jgi:hypothetical protein